MIGSTYIRHWEENPIKERISDICEEYPDDDTKFNEMPWTEDQQLDFVEGIEKSAGIELSDEDLFEVFSGDLTVSDFESMIKEACMEKYAKLSTPTQKASMKNYRMRNKSQIAIRDKIRRRKIKQGSKLKRKRMGNAATGYYFVADSSQNVAGSQKGSSIKAFESKDVGPRSLKMFSS